MATKPPSPAHVWFRRSVALTLAVGACVFLLVAARPGYAAFFVVSTLGFLLAGLLWSPGGSPPRGLRVPAPVALRPAPARLAPARTYRISATR
jgi:hypothetical protein